MDMCDLVIEKGVLRISKNPRRKVGGRFGVTVADEVCEVAETQTTHTRELKQSKVVFEFPEKMAREL